MVNERDEPTLLGEGLLIVHTLSGGERNLRLPRGAMIQANLPPRSTTVFDAETGTVLLA